MVIALGVPRRHTVSTIFPGHLVVSSPTWRWRVPLSQSHAKKATFLSQVTMKKEEGESGLKLMELAVPTASGSSRTALGLDLR